MAYVVHEDEDDEGKEKEENVEGSFQQQQQQLQQPRGSVYFDVRAFEARAGGRTRYGKLAPLRMLGHVLWGKAAAAVGMGDLGGQGMMDWPLLEMLQSQQRQRMDEMVAPLAAKYSNAHVSKVFEDISPAKGLADLSRDAQLVVVGSHGRGRLADSILGSVSQTVLHHAECPVLVVR